MSDANRMRNIVLVEDNPCDIFLVREALRSQDIAFELICYGDVPEALQGLFDETTPIPDVILLDLNLPKGEGLDVLRAVRNSERLMHVPLAILTSSQWPMDKERAMSLRVDRYIHKPVTLDAFLQEVGLAVSELLQLPAVPSGAAEGVRIGPVA